MPIRPEVPAAPATIPSQVAVPPAVTRAAAAGITAPAKDVEPASRTAASSNLAGRPESGGRQSTRPSSAGSGSGGGGGVSLAPKPLSGLQPTIAARKDRGDSSSDAPLHMDDLKDGPARSKSSSTTQTAPSPRDGILKSTESAGIGSSQRPATGVEKDSDSDSDHSNLMTNAESGVGSRAASVSRRRMIPLPTTESPEANTQIGNAQPTVDSTIFSAGHGESDIPDIPASAASKTTEKVNGGEVAHSHVPEYNTSIVEVGPQEGEVLAASDQHGSRAVGSSGAPPNSVNANKSAIGTGYAESANDTLVANENDREVEPEIDNFSVAVGSERPDSLCADESEAFGKQEAISAGDVLAKGEEHSTVDLERLPVSIASAAVFATETQNGAVATDDKHLAVGPEHEVLSAAVASSGGGGVCSDYEQSESMGADQPDSSATVESVSAPANDTLATGDKHSSVEPTHEVLSAAISVGVVRSDHEQSESVGADQPSSLATVEAISAPTNDTLATGEKPSAAEPTHEVLSIAVAGSGSGGVCSDHELSESVGAGQPAFLATVEAVSAPANDTLATGDKQPAVELDHEVLLAAVASSGGGFVRSDHEQSQSMGADQLDSSATVESVSAPMAKGDKHSYVEPTHEVLSAAIRVGVVRSDHEQPESVGADQPSSLATVEAVSALTSDTLSNSDKPSAVELKHEVLSAALAGSSSAGVRSDHEQSESVGVDQPASVASVESVSAPANDTLATGEKPCAAEPEHQVLSAAVASSGSVAEQSESMDANQPASLATVEAVSAPANDTLATGDKNLAVGPEHQVLSAAVASSGSGAEELESVRADQPASEASVEAVSAPANDTQAISDKKSAVEPKHQVLSPAVASSGSGAEQSESVGADQPTSVATVKAISAPANDTLATGEKPSAVEPKHEVLSAAVAGSGSGGVSSDHEQSESVGADQPASLATVEAISEHTLATGDKNLAVGPEHKVLSAAVANSGSGGEQLGSVGAASLATVEAVSAPANDTLAISDKPPAVEPDREVLSPTVASSGSGAEQSESLGADQPTSVASVESVSAPANDTLATGDKNLAGGSDHDDKRSAAEPEHQVLSAAVASSAIASLAKSDTSGTGAI